jgi:uncharacterized protein
MSSNVSYAWRTGLALAALLIANMALADRYWPPINTVPTEARLPGKWVWADLITRDVGRAAEFYGKVFGWTFETYGPKDDRETYTLVLSDGEPIGGMVYDWSKHPTDKSARWIGQISVTDVSKATAEVEAGGGRVLERPQRIGQRGEAALFTDPEGAMFAVLRSDSGDPEDWLGGENTWLWVELWADDPGAMGDFYKAVGSYQLKGDSVAGAPTGYHLVSGGYPRAGIRRKPVNVPSTWIPYVRVHSVEQTVARAIAAGADLVMEPQSVRGTTAALLLDPSGAPFAVAEWPAS